METNMKNEEARFFDESVGIVKYQLAELADENAALKAQLEELNMALRKRETVMAQLESDLEKKREEVRQLRHVHSRYLTRLDALSRLGAETPVAASSHSDVIANLEATIDSLLTSTSWRITKPLRWLKTKLVG